MCLDDHATRPLARPSSGRYRSARGGRVSRSVVGLLAPIGGPGAAQAENLPDSDPFASMPVRAPADEEGEAVRSARRRRRGLTHRIGQGNGEMRAQTLRLYRGPEDEVATAPSARMSADNQRVTAPASQILPLLADALRSQRTWLEDFADDEVTLSADLYEVLMAYQHFRRPVA